jgi:hypothetical protein
MADNHFKIHKGVTIAPQPSPPSNPTNGDIYYDSGLDRFQKYEAGSWQDLGSVNFNGYTKDNLLINGNFDFWQRGTTLSSGAGDKYLADRWKSSSNVESYLLQFDTPNDKSVYSALIARTTSGASDVTLEQRIEARSLKRYEGKQLTVSFYCKQNTGSQPVSIEVYANTAPDNGVFGLPVVTATSLGTPTSSWDIYTYTFTVNSALANNGGRVVLGGLSIVAPANYYFSQVQMIEGTSNPTDYILSGKTIDGELSLCKRFYEKSYIIDVSPGTVTNVGYNIYYQMASNTTEFNTTVFMQVEKRAIPTVVLYNPATGTINQGSRGGTATAGGSINPGTKQFRAFISSGVNTNQFFFHWIADSEL